MATPLARGPAIAFGVFDLLAATIVLYVVFGALPARWAPVDVGAVVLTLALAAAAVAVLARRAWSARIARVASFVVLGIGLALVALLFVTASYLAGIYGAVGHGGAAILGLGALLAIPYLVALPAAQLVWLGR